MIDFGHISPVEQFHMGAIISLFVKMKLSSFDFSQIEHN